MNKNQTLIIIAITLSVQCISFSKLVYANSAQPNRLNEDQVCFYLESLGLLNLKSPFFPTLWAALRYKFDKRRFSKWVINDSEPNSTSKAEDKPHFTIISLLPKIIPDPSLNEKSLKNQLRNVFDKKLIQLMRAKNIDQCKKQAVENNIGLELVKDNFAKFQALMDKAQLLTNIKTVQAVNEFVEEASSKNKMAEFTYYDQMNIAQLLDLLRNTRRSTSVIIVGHAFNNGKMVSAEEVELPLSTFTNLSPYIRGLYFLTCYGEAVRDRYLKELHIDYGYIKTKKFIKQELNLSVNALKPLLNDLVRLSADLIVNLPDNDSDEQKTKCIAILSTTQSSTSFLFFNRQLITAHNAWQSSSTEFPCDSLLSEQSESILVLSRLNSSAQSEGAFPSYISIVRSDNPFFTIAIFEKAKSNHITSPARELRYSRLPIN